VAQSTESSDVQGDVCKRRVRTLHVVALLIFSSKHNGIITRHIAKVNDTGSLAVSPKGLQKNSPALMIPETTPTVNSMLASSGKRDTCRGQIYVVFIV
jgi:hypothetical protein